jgi:endoglucanase
MVRRGLFRTVALLGVLGATVFSVTAASGRPTSSHASVRTNWSLQCADPYPATRDPSNPLMLPQAPGPNPLNGAHFFVDGPAHGVAAGAVARMLGLNPKAFPDNYSWAQFKADIAFGQFHARYAALSQKDQFEVQSLFKIADQPEAQRFSAYVYGNGNPDSVMKQVWKIFCHNLTADPGSIPIITTYFLHPDVGKVCKYPSKIQAAAPRFKSQIDAMAQATGNRPAVYLLEIDAIGTSTCGRGLSTYLSLLHYEVDKIRALPHTVVYIEGGYSDSHDPTYTAKALNKAGVRSVRGFFTNDTHLNWTIDEVRWADKVSKMTGGAHFIVNTSDNGNGPKKNPHPVKQGIEDLCNPPNRAIGPLPTTHTGFPLADAWLWEHVPGESSGRCNGGPPSGTFWPARAVQLAAAGTYRLGPRYPAQPN